MPTQKRILVAEDDHAILEVVKIILKNDNFEVITTDNEKTIFKIINEDPPDLMLLDIWLGGNDGGKIAKEIKSKKATKKIPIIMISANNETEKIAKNSGADGFLLKPFNIDDLLDIVKKHVK
jgi:DNA-binding response OmpR family regulator